MNTRKRTPEQRDQIDHTELAYRRGFHQATADILAALYGGATREQLGRFEEAVSDWRERQLWFEPTPLVGSYREGN